MVGQGPGPADRSSETRIHTGNLLPLVLAAQLSFPRSHRLRHPAHAGRAARKARLRGPAAYSAGLTGASRLKNQGAIFLTNLALSQPGHSAGLRTAAFDPKRTLLLN